MAKNDFKPFATAANANVMSQDDWEELPALLSGFTSGKAASAEVNKAIRQATFIASAVAQFVSDSLSQDILDDGDSQAFVVKLEQAIVNGSVPSGIPMPWPQPTPPDGWLKCNGAKFDKEQYPKLAVAYPAGVLPDLRGEFLRGWDDGRGVDTSRELLSNQQDAIRNITGSIGWDGGRLFSLADGAFGPVDGAGVKEVATTDEQGGVYTLAHANFDASLVVPTAEENRPRNVAFNYIVRAA